MGGGGEGKGDLGEDLMQTLPCIVPGRIRGKGLGPALRQVGRVGSFLWHLLFLSCLRLKMLLVPKWHLWEVAGADPLHS